MNIDRLGPVESVPSRGFEVLKSKKVGALLLATWMQVATACGGQEGPMVIDVSKCEPFAMLCDGQTDEKIRFCYDGEPPIEGETLEEYKKRTGGKEGVKEIPFRRISDGGVVDSGSDDDAQKRFCEVE